MKSDLPLKKGIFKTNFGGRENYRTDNRNE